MAAGLEAPPADKVRTTLLLVVVTVSVSEPVCTSRNEMFATRCGHLHTGENGESI